MATQNELEKGSRAYVLGCFVCVFGLISIGGCGQNRDKIASRFRTLSGHILVTVALLFSLCAAADDRGFAAISADLGTTAMGIAEFGAVEANPTALPLLPLRLWVVGKSGECSDIRRYSDTASWAAAANNLLVIAGGPTLVALIVAIPLNAHYRHRQIDCKIDVLHRVFAMHEEQSCELARAPKWLCPG